MRNVSEEDRQIQLDCSANNIISESCHASATEGLQQFGRIRLDYSGVPWVNAEPIMILVGDMKLTHQKDA